MDSKSGPISRRLFLALWPGDGVRWEIASRRDLLGTPGRPVPDHNLHLTLLFLGNCPAGALPVIREAAGDVRAGGFDLLLGAFGYFPRARVVWLGGEVPAAGRALVSDLSDAMRAAGIGFDRRRWQPHVTLFRKVSRRPALPAPPPLKWPVREFVLVESVPGKPYRVLKTWHLK